jgi:hypothetical protein
MVLSIMVIVLLIDGNLDVRWKIIFNCSVQGNLIDLVFEVFVMIQWR